MTKSRAVMNAPISTSFQRMMASGRNRYIIANNSVVTPSDSAKSTSWMATTPIMGNACCSQPVKALSTALTTNEMSSSSATLKIKPKDNTRCLMKAPMPMPSVLTFRFQMSLMLSWSVTKKVVAAKISVDTPMAVATGPRCCRVNLAMLSSRNFAESTPTSPFSCP